MVESSTMFDAILDLCRDQHRRIILATLAHEKRSLTINDLLMTIVKYNHHAPIAEVSEDTVTEIRLSLHHRHIPKLVEYSLVKYNQERKLVEPTAKFGQWESQILAILNVDSDITAPLSP